MSPGPSVPQQRAARFLTDTPNSLLAGWAAAGGALRRSVLEDVAAHYEAVRRLFGSGHGVGGPLPDPVPGGPVEAEGRGDA